MTDGNAEPLATVDWQARITSDPQVCHGKP
jgi:uncharacterized protein (DUF433 family)